MDILEICASTTNWVDSAHDTDYWKSPCEFGIDPPDSISYGVTFYSYTGEKQLELFGNAFRMVGERKV